MVDVGGGSSELVVGTAPDQIGWSTSFGVGSGDLADHFLRSDPPAAEELSTRPRAHIVPRARRRFAAPHPAEAVAALGGSAASLRRLAGPLLDGDSFAGALSLLAAEPASEISRRFALDIERVRLLPAGLLILEAASELFGQPLQIGRGGSPRGRAAGGPGMSDQEPRSRSSRPCLRATRLPEVRVRAPDAEVTGGCRRLLDAVNDDAQVKSLVARVRGSTQPGAGSGMRTITGGCTSRSS